MTDRYDACTPRPKRDGGTFWLKIGSAFPAKSGEGFNVILDALPLPDKEGRCTISLFPSKPREQKPAQGGGTGADISDEIPF